MGIAGVTIRFIAVRSIPTSWFRGSEIGPQASGLR